MDEPPGTRMRVALSALTMAEYFRDVKHQDVLLFIDNIFRFTQAGSEVSTLLGRMPSAVGYQPRWPTRWVSCRSESPRRRVARSPRCRRSTCPPTTTPTGAGHHLRAPRCDHRALTSDLAAGYLPAVDPLTSTSRILEPRSSRRALPRRQRGQAHPAEVQGTAGHHRHPRYGRALRRGQGDRAARASHPEVPRPELPGRREVHRTEGSVVPLADTIEAFDRVCKGEFDHYPEQAFNSCGGLDDVEAAAEKIAGK